MLPPIPIETLNSNPQFHKLYTTLTTRYLDPTDGSSIPTPEEAEKDASLEQDLRAHRADLSRLQILRDALIDLPSLTVLTGGGADSTSSTATTTTAATTATPPGLGLSDEILDIVSLACTTYLYPTQTLTCSSPAASAITAAIDEDFRAVVDVVGQAIGWYLTHVARTLVGIIDPTNDLPPPPGTTSGSGGGATVGGSGGPATSSTSTQPQPQPQPDIDLLPAYAAHRRHMLQAKRKALIASYNEITLTTATILSHYATYLHSLLAHMDASSGVVDKGVRAQAECLALVVSGFEGKLRIMRGQARRAVYPPEAVDALGNYSHHLVDTKVRLAARQRMVEEELRRYEKKAGGGGGELAGLVRRYAEALGRMEEVGKEIRRLGG